MTDVHHRAALAGQPLDLVLLGVGAEGHRAPLFPDDPAREERGRWVLPSRAPALPETAP